MFYVAKPLKVTKLTKTFLFNSIKHRYFQKHT